MAKTPIYPKEIPSDTEKRDEQRKVNPRKFPKRTSLNDHIRSKERQFKGLNKMFRKTGNYDYERTILRGFEKKMPNP